ncbi:MAG: DUF2917 domain-containing protein [Janthinobacterium lividum]
MSTAHTSGMTAIATRTLYEIAPGAPVRWTLHATGQVRACAGRLWLTREGDPWDYWLETGDVMPVVAGDVFWASVEGAAPGRLEMRAQMARVPVWRQAWRALCAAAGASGGSGTAIHRAAIRGASCDAAARVHS